MYLIPSIVFVKPYCIYITIRRGVYCAFQDSRDYFSLAFSLALYAVPDSKYAINTYQLLHRRMLKIEKHFLKLGFYL